jgi:hypothetical protein
VSTMRDIDERPAKLQAALIKITESLARELACPARAAPDWSELEWTLARAVAAMHGVAPLLQRTLCWQGPAPWTNFLEEQRAHVSARHARIEQLVLRIDGSAREAGVPMMTLKGVALHAMGLYERGERPMADVDLLVHPQDAGRSARLIESLGFRECSKSWKERAFAPLDGHAAGALGEHRDNDIKIELHERICERLPLRITDITSAVFPSRMHPGLNGYASSAALMAHLLLHAAGSMTAQGLRLLHLHDLALLARRMTEEDWDELLARRSTGRGLWWALPPLELMLRYYASPIPARVHRALESDCPWLLRRSARRRTLSEVSYSHLWVDAFPGIEWSQSIRDLLSYARSRVRPDAQHLALRKLIVTTQGWAADSQWSSLSQARRILRWMTARQARPATMHVLRAVLKRAQ